MNICPVCLAPVDKYPKGEVVITRLDGTVVTFPQWQVLVREEEFAKKFKGKAN